MNKSLVKINSHSAEGQLVNTDLVNAVYDELNFDSLLKQYANHRGGIAIESLLQDAFTEFAVELSSISLSDAGIDVELIREGFDRLYAGMNSAAGLEITTGVINKLLVKSGVRSPRYKNVILPLDDKYWNQQFLQQYADESLVQRSPQEPDQTYLARYIHFCLKGFPWAYFTYAV